MSGAIPGADDSTTGPPGAELPTREDEIENFHLIELLGEGGMGEVYKAEQRGAVQRVVAVKIIRAGLDSKTVIARFEAERQALALMNHPNIAKVFDGGSTKLGRPYFVMEYVAGQPITSYCDRHKLPIRARLELFQAVCAAVQHAHTKGIIHRDLKASNVLVAEQDGELVPKVIDFGVAKALNQRLTEKTLFTESGRLVGTPAYASPEQAEGGPDVDTRTDVYSLGVLLYELLTGALPFDPTKLREMAYGEMQRIIREVDPPRPSTFYSRPSESSKEAAQRRAATVEELASTLRHELEWIPLRAMRKERTERYQTAADFARDIENYLAGRALVAAPDSRWYRVKKSVKRNRKLVAALSAVMLTLILGIVMTTWQARRAEYQRQLAEENAAEARKRLAHAEASAQLLNEMLGGVLPDVVQGRDTALMIEVLRAAEPKLEAILTEPSWRAFHLVLLGNAYRVLGEYDRSRLLLERARTLAQQSFDDAISRGAFDTDYKEARTLIEALDRLAYLELYQRNNAAAEKLFREALNLAQKHVPASDPHLVHRLSNLATAMEYQGKFLEAEQLHQQAFDTAAGAPQDHPAGDRAALAMKLGSLRVQQNDTARAEQALDLAESLHREAELTQTSTFANLLSIRGTLEQNRARYDRAVELFTQAIDLRRRLSSRGNPVFQVFDLERRSLCHRHLGQLSPAADDLIEAARIRRVQISDTSLGNQLEIARLLDQAAWLLHEAARAQEALAVLKDTMQLYQAAHGVLASTTPAPGGEGEHDATIRNCQERRLACQQRWAQLALLQASPAEALEVIRDCLSQQEQLYAGNVTPDALTRLGTSQWVLAEALLKRGDEADRQQALELLLLARDNLSRAGATTQPTIGGHRSTRERVLRTLQTLYDALGQQEQAQQIGSELTSFISS